MKKGWFVYIVETKSGRLYTGITTDISRRMREHKGGQKKRGAKFFNISEPKGVLYSEAVQSRSQACKREAIIKGMTREQKLNLIFRNNN